MRSLKRLLAAQQRGRTKTACIKAISRYFMSDFEKEITQELRTFDYFRTPSIFKQLEGQPLQWKVRMNDEMS